VTFAAALGSVAVVGLLLLLLLLLLLSG